MMKYTMYTCMKKVSLLGVTTDIHRTRNGTVITKPADREKSGKVICMTDRDE